MPYGSSSSYGNPHNSSGNSSGRKKRSKKDDQMDALNGMYSRSMRDDSESDYEYTDEDRYEYLGEPDRGRRRRM